MIFLDNPPPKVYCQWGSWGSAECSRTCGGGTRTRVRSKTLTEINTACSGSPIKVEPCNTAKCQNKYLLQLFHNTILWCNIPKCHKQNKISFLQPKVYCQWGSWFVGGCSKPCGGGTQTMVRQKTQIEVGTACNGDNIKQVSCNTEKCPGKL